MYFKEKKFSSYGIKGHVMIARQIICRDRVNSRVERTGASMQVNKKSEEKCSYRNGLRYFVDNYTAVLRKKAVTQFFSVLS